MRILYILLVVLVICLSSLTFYFATVNFRARVSLSQVAKVVEKEFNSRLKQEKEQILETTSEKYRGRLDSYGEIAKELEQERARVKELSSKAKEEPKETKKTKESKKKKAKDK